MFHDLAFVNPDLDTDDTHRGLGFGGSVIDVGAQRMKRDGALIILLGAGNFRTAETTTADDLAALGAHAHRRLHRTLHRAAESDTSLKLRGDVLGNKLRVRLSLTNLLDVRSHKVALRELLQLSLKLLDACAAPGGKTAQAIALGATVTALDRSGRRLEVLERNLSRLRMQATVVRGDLRLFKAEGGFDAVLLDAPCSATGTIRRHPEIAWTRKEEDIQGIAEQQRHMISHAAALVRPGGQLVYCTCSLEPEEGEAQAQWFYDSFPEFRRVPVNVARLGLPAEAVTAAGDLRTHSGLMAGAGGMDGFFATCAVRSN